MDDIQEMRDQILSSFNDIYDKEPTEEQVAFIFNLIPQRIKLLADEWGWNETEVRDYIYVLIRDNKEMPQ
ncbi:MULTISPECIES: hypothetical protein [Paenibacillus]|uniref:Uncharacterized protein n=2 Tax=Paenibacillus TaxID=44249 RepID=A0ABX2ZDP9_PAEPO|nr:MULTISPECIES: hypothetical protein [Paenibacillus]MDR6779403.1 hypothetical protein [Paenibacillus peoriae]ODA08299.1 hypothetical protein A7312_27570 [Paenibacillus polymyxa]